MQPTNTGNKRHYLRHMATALRWCATTVRTLVLGAAIVGALAFLGLSVGPRVLGLETRAVMSGSMEPAIATGAAVFVQPRSGQDGREITIGDVILFNTPDRDEATVHRVVDINEADGTYTTQGDANNRADARPVAHGEVLGFVVADVPYIGYAAVAMDSKTVSSLLLILPGLIIILFEVPVWYRFVRYGAAAFENESGSTGSAPDGDEEARSREGVTP